MKEKGSYLHIIFIFIGVAALALGVFYYLTEDKTNNPLDNQETTNNTEKEEEKDEEQKEEKKIVTNKINSIKLNDGEETTVTLGNNSVKLLSKINVDEREIYYNGSLIINDSKDLINKYYSYNDNLVVFNYSLTDNTGIIYVVDNNFKVEKFEELDINNRKMIPVSVDLDNDKLIVTGNRIINNKIILQNSEVDICNDDELEKNNILGDTPLKIEYYLNISNNNVSFDFIKVSNTLESIKKLICESVE